MQGNESSEYVLPTMRHTSGAADRVYERKTSGVAMSALPYVLSLGA